VAVATGGGVTHSPLPRPTSVVIELIGNLQDPTAAVEAWVTEDRMLNGTRQWEWS
jgi:hypothetical protein